MNEKRTRGLLLIGIGIILLIARLSDAGGELAVLIIGAAFLVGFAFTHNMGLLIPGGIMTGLGAGILVEANGSFTPGAPVLLGLGLGFFLIYFVAQVTATRHRGDWWPLIPGAILSFIGAALFANMTGFLQVFNTWWPVILIAVGVWFLLTRPKRPRE